MINGPKAYRSEVTSEETRKLRHKFLEERMVLQGIADDDTILDNPACSKKTNWFFRHLYKAYLTMKPWEDIYILWREYVRQTPLFSEEELAVVQKLNWLVIIMDEGALRYVCPP